MKLFFSAAALALALSAGGASAADPTEKDAIAMTERGVALMKAQGKDAMIKAINAKDPDFVQGSLYLFMRDLKSGVMIAHPMNPGLVGKDLTDVPDAAGKKFRREILDVAAKSGKGWVSYMYRNPTTEKVEPKMTYLVRVDDVILEAGIYKKTN